MYEDSKLFLLDAYALIYRAYFGLSKVPRINSKGFNTSAVFGFVNTLQQVLAKEQPTHIGVAFDPAGPTFRHEAYPEYKAQREETPETIRLSVPVIKDIIRAYRIPILEVPGYEADDVIGTLATQAREKGITTYMMTPDKDYGQLVGGCIYMYRPKFGDKEFEVMDADKVKAKFDISTTGQVIDMLGLMGDSSDNIPGCPGVGEKTAQRLIAEFGSIENLLLNTDRLKGALKKKVEENADKIRFSKFLATIKTDVPLTLDMDGLRRKEPDRDKLAELFGEMEFKSLMARVLGDGHTDTPQTDKSQPSLFELFPTDGQAEDFHSNLASYDAGVQHYHLVESDEDIERFLQLFLTKDFFSLDTETTGIEPMTARLVGMSFACREGEAYYIPAPADPAAMERLAAKLRPLVGNERTLKIGQNIKYDMIVLARHGMDVRGPLFDTMIAHYVIQPELRHNMDFLAETYLGYRTIHIEQLIGEKGRNQKSMGDLTPESIYVYACEDADITLRLKAVLERQLHEQGCFRLFEQVEMPLIPALAKMEMNGVRIDTDSLRQTSASFTGRMTEIEHEVYAMAGMQFNISSPKQVGEVLFDRMHISDNVKKTKSGQYSTSEEVLESLKGRHPIVEKILEYRGYKKLLGTYVDALPRLINPETGKIHTSFNQAVTATGRLSSSNPNLQNIPVRDDNGREIRKAFIPDDGEVFLSADYSQVELRIMAHLSGDENMIGAFLSGEDIHAATAAKIYGIPLGEVTKDMRRKAKTANFGIIYGISAFGLAERMGVDRREAKTLIDDYFKTYPGIKAFIDRSIDEARQRGYVETVFHRRRYLPDINSRNAVVRGMAERNAVNAPIQGSAADIIKVAMARIHRRLEEGGFRAKMLLQVHDELNFSVPVDELERVREIVVDEMQAAYAMRVPLVADSGTGSNWLEAH